MANLHTTFVSVLDSTLTIRHDLHPCPSKHASEDVVGKIRRDNTCSTHHIMGCTVVVATALTHTHRPCWSPNTVRCERHDSRLRQAKWWVVVIATVFAHSVRVPQSTSITGQSNHRQWCLPHTEPPTPPDHNIVRCYSVPVETMPHRPHRQYELAVVHLSQNCSSFHLTQSTRNFLCLGRTYHRTGVMSRSSHVGCHKTHSTHHPHDAHPSQRTGHVEISVISV